ncbi:hypothetical protein ACNKHO_00275 [Shigella flexneri]
MAVRKAKDIGYPLVVRPSYVLGGRAMEIVYDEADLVATSRPPSAYLTMRSSAGSLPRRCN